MSQDQGSPSQGAPTSDGPSSLPDLNQGKYSFEYIQELVDQAAWINLFVVPGAGGSGAAIPAPGDSTSTIGIAAKESVHRFDINLQLPTLATGVRASNVVGPPSGTADLRWLIIPWDFVARPDREPPPTKLDPSTSQRFVMQEAEFRFGNGRDGFGGFGTGRTIPSMSGELEAIAVGNMIRGFGKFRGLEGTFVLSGRIEADHGFTGDVLLRAVDPNGVLKAASPIPPIADPMPVPDPGVTYVMVRSQKTGPQQETLYSFTPQGEVRGLIVPQDLRCVRVAFDLNGSGGVESEIDMGPFVGPENGYVTTNPLQPGPGAGTADDPSIFQGAGEYAFTDQQGQSVGGFNAQFLEGRTFNMEFQGAPGQIAARFGFVGPIISGSGYGSFRGVEGLMTGSTGVGISPHVFSNLYVLRLNDPDGRYRAAIDSPACG